MTIDIKRLVKRTYEVVRDVDRKLDHIIETREHWPSAYREFYSREGYTDDAY